MLIREIPNFYKVEDVLRGHNITDKGDSYELPCPFHKDSRPSFRILKKSGVYHCFSCNASGSLLKLIYLLSNSNLSFFHFAEKLLTSNKLLQNTLGFASLEEEHSFEQQSIKRFKPNPNALMPLTTLQAKVMQFDNSFEALATSLTLLQDHISPELILQIYTKASIDLTKELVL